MTKPKYSVNVSRRTHSSVKKHRTRLGDRRHSARVRVMSILGILSVFLGILVVIALWQGAVRVSHIHINNNDASLIAVVKKSISGTHLLVPDNSIFLLSESRIRNAILQARPTIAAVSISRTGFDSISVALDMRTPLARWCGTSASSTPHDTIVLDTLSSGSGCYFFDGTGFLYTSVPTPSTSTILSAIDQPLVPYRMYASLVKTTAASASSSPILSTLSSINKLPALFDFAREISSFGSPVISIVLRGDEVDLFLKDSTRITYVLGKEQSAYALLMTTKKRISIGDGSLLYIDLRFHGKVYYLPQKIKKL